MTRIPVEKAHGADAPETDELTEQIRKLAFHLFESRGGSEGNALDDWLAAERELIETPDSEVVQRDGKFEIRIPARGFEAGDIHVTALPGSLAVRAASNKLHEGNTRGKVLFETIEFSEPIDVEKTTAKLDNGSIYVTAVRRSQGRERVAV